MPENADTAASLTAAFHAVYDVKDGLNDPGSINSPAYDAYLAIRALSDLMQKLGIEVPRRFDK